MQHRTLPIFRSLAVAMSAAVVAIGAIAQQATELRVLVHSSYALPKPLVAQFEKDNNIKLRVTKGGDAGEMLNKLILTRANPIADVVFGIDNALAPKALAAQVLDTYSGPAASRPSAGPLPAPLVPVDYGYVTLNYDRTWFAKAGLPLPRTLDELTQPAYAGLLVVQNPATSSTGNAFLLATIGAMGEGKAWDWWGRMRANGLKVAKGWSESYYTEFSRNGGKHPLVVSYVTSPAAEIFYAKDKPAEPPTASLALGGGVFRQVEGVALVRGGGAPQAAAKFIEFLRSEAVQSQLQTEMWMFPVEKSVARADVMKFAPEPAAFTSPSDREIAEKNGEWVSRWSRVVLK